MNHYIEISHRAYWRRSGAYDAFFRNRPTIKALELLKILTCVPVATVRARSRFAWKQAQRCVRPCGTPCTLCEECTLHKHGVRTHQHMSTGTYTAHHALHGVSRILNIPTVLPRISRLHLLDIRTVASPTTIQLTPPKHTSHTHEQTEGRQTACAVVPSLSDTLADCATVATPFLGGKICHVHRPPRCAHAAV